MSAQLGDLSHREFRGCDLDGKEQHASVDANLGGEVLRKTQEDSHLETVQVTGCVSNFACIQDG